MINSRMPLNNKALNFNPIQDGGQKAAPLPVFPLYFLQT